MQRMPFKVAILAAFLIAGTLPAAASQATPEPPDENTIIKEYEFTTQERPFVYNMAPKTYNEAGREYVLQGDIAYELISETELFTEEAKEFTRSESKQGLAAQNDDVFPESVTIDEDGFYGKIQRASVQYQARSVDGGSKTHSKSIAYGYQPEPPAAPESTVLQVKGESIDLPFVRMDESGAHWQENHVARLILYSDSGVYTFEGRRSIDLTTDSPEWQGLEFDLMQQMKLDPGTHIIQSAVWENSLTDDGVTVERSIKFTMKRLVSKYTAIYSVTIQNPDNTVYDGTATYKGILSKPTPNGVEYLVKAKVTYYSEPKPTPTPSPTPEPTPEPEPLAEPEPEKKGGVGGVIAFMLIAGILGGGAFFVLKWKKQRDAES